MATQVDICNWALGRVAVSRQISSLNETSQEAVTCSLWLDQLIDAMLREYSWPFARRVQSLALVEAAPTTEWAFSYRTPADCLRVVRIVDGTSLPWTPFPMDIAGDDLGGLIYCDIEDAQLQYVARVSDSNRWPPDFADALAWRLASEIAGPLSQSGALADRAARMYYQTVARAQSIAANELVPIAPPDPDWIKGRN